MNFDENKLRAFGKLICRVAQGEELSKEETFEAYRQVILNEQPELQQGAFLAAHIQRGPTTEELSAAWHALDEFDTAKINIDSDEVICDIVGTGSDNLKTVNCSTPAAVIAAAAGLKIAKKGARLVTGVSGASDIFQLLGLNLDAPLEQAEKALNETGLCYLPGEAFLKSGWARLIQSMRFTSAFNIIGPLTRPCAQTSAIVIGAYSPEVCRQLVDVLKEINMPAALAPYGKAENIPNRGMDEFSVCGPTEVVQLLNGEIETYTVTPEDFGLKTRGYEEIASKRSAQENADAVLSVLKGEYDSALADFFVMNAAAALFIAGKADSYKQAVKSAKEALASGKAYEKLQQFLEIQNG